MDKSIYFEFEGVYQDSEVYLNGVKAAECSYGYNGFYVDAVPYLQFGSENEIIVLARNSNQPNSRWYTGAGIYRPVTLHIGEQKHILPNGIKVRTISLEPAVVEINVKTNVSGMVHLQVFQNETIINSVQIESDGNISIKIQLLIEFRYSNSYNNR